MVRIAHRRNVLFVDGQIYDTFTNVFSCLAARKFGYAHSEILFSDGVAFSSLFRIGAGECILPDFARPDGGLAMFRRNAYPVNEWRYTNLPISFEQEIDLRASCESLTRECIAENERYDKFGVLKFVIPFSKEDPKGYFCSEATYNRIQRMFHFFDEYQEFKVSPNLLARLCEKKFGPVLKA